MVTNSHPYQPHTFADEPGRLAFRMCSTGEAVTFAELEARANRGAHLLRRLGIGTRDHIAILMENRREFLEICFAADRTGVYYTTISTHLTRDEIAYILEDCGAKLLIASDRFLDLVAELDSAADRRCATMVVGQTPPSFESWSEAVARQPEFPIEDEAQGLDMLYSSGTTGRPKGVLWPLPNDRPGGRTMLVDLLTSLFGYAADTRYLCPAPLYHAAPLRHTMVTLKMGGCAYIMERFDAQDALGIIEA